MTMFFSPSLQRQLAEELKQKKRKSPLVQGAEVAGPQPATTTSPMVPGAETAGPKPATSLAEQGASLDAKMYLLKKTLAHASGAERPGIQENLRGLSTERSAVSGATAPGPKFVDAQRAGASTKNLLEQALLEVRRQMSGGPVVDPNLAARERSLMGDIAKVDSGEYAREYNSPERVAARDNATRMADMRRKVMEQEAMRMIAERKRREEAPDRQAELDGAAHAARLAELEYGPKSLEQRHRLGEAQIGEVQANSGLKARKAESELSTEELQRRTLQLAMDERRRAAEDARRLQPETETLAREKIGAETDIIKAKGAQARNEYEMYKQLHPLQAKSSVDMEKARLGYGAAGYADRGTLLTRADELWRPIEKQLGSWMSGRSDVVGPGAFSLTARPAAADEFNAGVIAPLLKLSEYSPEEARLIAQQLIRKFPTEAFTPHFGFGSSRPELAQKLNEIRETLRQIAGS